MYGRRAHSAHPYDGLSPAAGLYSVARRCRSGYNGPIILLRNLTTDVETPIGFKADGSIDEAAIIGACGAAVGAVTALYDLTGGGKPLTITTESQMPVIYNGSTIYKLNNRPAMSFDGSASRIMRTDCLGLTGAPALTIMAAAKATAVGVKHMYGLGRANRATVGSIVGLRANTTSQVIVTTNTASTTYSMGAGAMEAAHYSIFQRGAGADVGSQTLELNGAALTETGEVSGTTVPSMLDERCVLGAIPVSGAGGGVDNFYTGLIGEFAVFNALLAGEELIALRHAGAGVIV